MKYNLLFVVVVLLTEACNNNSRKTVNVNSDSISPFAKARKTFVTKITRRIVDSTEPDKPPKGLFNLIEYPSNIGNMAAYVSPIQQDGKLHPAIIWIIGGFGNGIGDEAWTPGPPANDQSASALWKAGLITMYPSQRGGNLNPGSDETFYGEIDDIVAAAKYLAKQPGIDPQRIYLGGHSTGGTKALLAAESSGIFRATFSVGGVTAGYVYGWEHVTFDTTNNDEFYMRMPIQWLSSIRTPVFLFDGSIGSNADEMHKLKDTAVVQNNSFTHFCEIKHATHFTICLPLCKIFAQKILADTSAVCNISFDEAQVNTAFDKLAGKP